MSKSSISTNQELRKGEYLLSTSGNYKAVFEEDGNFVIYKWAPIWSSDTKGKDGFRIVVQEDNNLVMYNSDFKPVWVTGTDCSARTDRMRLTMTNDGQLVLDRNGGKIWSS